jgi:hypothetical protein
MESGQTGYRLFVFDEADHIRQPAIRIEARDDGEAIASAQCHRSGHAVELWNFGRLVLRLGPPYGSATDADDPDAV